jgi:hypothetical protein
MLHPCPHPTESTRPLSGSCDGRAVFVITFIARGGVLRFIPPFATTDPFYFSIPQTAPKPPHASWHAACCLPGLFKQGVVNCSPSLF